MPIAQPTQVATTEVTSRIIRQASGKGLVALLGPPEVSTADALAGDPDFAFLVGVAYPFCDRVDNPHRLEFGDRAATGHRSRSARGKRRFKDLGSRCHMTR